MYARRCWYCVWLMQRFEWTWNWNFQPGAHQDANLWLFTWQGVCGAAYRTERAKFVRLDGQLADGSRLTHWQAKRTSHVLAILSVPMLLQSKQDSQSYKCVGVINIDAVTDEAADVLERNADALSEYFMKQGLMLAELR